MSAYLGIGIIQCLAMIPGTSHSGSTIVGGLLLGPDKRAAAEFSFYLVMPTMVGGIRARPLREPPHSLDCRSAGHRHGLHRRVRNCGVRGALPARLCVAPAMPCEVGGG